jgi:hypothetical protein
LVLAVLAALAILLVVAFLPQVGRGLGLAPGPVGSSGNGPAPPLAPLTGPRPAGPVIPSGPVLPPAAVGPLRVEVRDADDQRPVSAAAVEVRIFGDAVTSQLVDPATVEPHLRKITELRNRALLERSRPQLYHRTLRADEGGVALFAGVPAGQAEIVATEREDRVSVWAVARPAVGPPSSQRPPVIVELQRATGRITGRVIDESGAPKPGAEILVVRNRPPLITSRAYAYAKRNPYHRTEAGPDGRFVLEAMPLFDKYIVHAKLRGWGSASSEYLRVERAAATEVTLVLRRNRIVRGVVEGAAAGADLTQARLVAYVVQDDDWRPGDSMRVSMETLFPVQPDAEGRYEVSAPNTRRYVVIEATLPGHAPVRVVADLGAGGAAAGVERAVRFAGPGRTLAGRVVDGAGRPVRAQVTFVRESDSLQLAPVETDAEGRFSADWLGDEAYSVIAHPHAQGETRLPPVIAGQIRPDRHDLTLVCE